MVSHPEASLHITAETTVVGDTTRIAQVFENLFRNAIEYGGSEVTITVGSVPDGDGFYVEDDGPGIPEADREVVFDRGHTTSSTGTGFRLAIVKEIVAAHGWTITLTDSASGGARFEITGVTLGDE